MSTTYAGDDTNFPASITIASDGDPKPVASVNVGLEGLADRTATLGRIVPPTSFGVIARPVSSIPKIVEISGVPSWDYNGGVKLTQVDIDALGPTPNAFYVVLQVPHGCTLSTVYAYLKGHSGHSVLPDIMPTMTVYKQRINTGAAAVSIGTGTDTAADVTAYQALHSIPAVCNEVIDNSINVYWIAFAGERDVDTAVAGLEFYGFVTLCTVTTIDPGAA